MEITVHNSSLVKRIRYNDQSNELVVQFMSGDIYVYQNVTKTVAGAIAISDSPGSEFNRLVRNNKTKYPFYKNNRLSKGFEKAEERTSNGGYTKPRTTAHKAQPTATTRTATAAKPRARKTPTLINVKAAVDNVIRNVRENMKKNVATPKTNNRTTTKVNNTKRTSR